MLTIEAVIFRTCNLRENAQEVRMRGKGPGLLTWYSDGLEIGRLPVR